MVSGLCLQWLEDDKVDKKKTRSKPTSNISLNSVCIHLELPALMLLFRSVFSITSGVCVCVCVDDVCVCVCVRACVRACVCVCV